MKKTVNHIRNKQAGLTMVELLIAITMSLLLIAGVGYGASKFIANNKTKTSLEDMPLIFAKAQKIYSSAATYAGITITNLVNNRAFPAELVVAGTPPTVNNRYGGAITVAAGTIVSANDGVLFTLSNVDEEACADLVNGLQNTTSRVRVDTVVVKPIGGTLDVAALGTNCNDSATNVVDFLVGK